MPVLNDAWGLYLGSNPVEQVCLGNERVWPAPLVPPSDPVSVTPVVGITGGITLVSGVFVPVEGTTLIAAVHCVYSGMSWTLSISDSWGLSWTQVASVPASGAAPPDLCGSVLFVSSRVPFQPAAGTVNITCNTVTRDSVHAMQAEFFSVAGAGSVGVSGSTPAQNKSPLDCTLSSVPDAKSLVVGTIGNYNGGAVSFTPPNGWTAFPTVRASGYSWEQFSFKNGNVAQVNTWSDASRGADSIASIEIQGRPEGAL